MLFISIPPDLISHAPMKYVIQKTCFEGFLISFEAGFLQFMMEICHQIRSSLEETAINQDDNLSSALLPKRLDLHVFLGFIN